jgi:hypothetical protein
VFLRIPSYEATFRTFSNRVILKSPLTGDAAADAAALLAALESGNIYTAIDALASPARLDVRFNGGSLVARVNGSVPGTIVIRRNGRVVAEQPLPEATFDTTGEKGPLLEGAYRVEVYLPQAAGRPPVPWLLGNPSNLFNLPNRDSTAAHSPAVATWSIQGGPWHVEKDADSAGQVTHAEPPAGPVEFRYGLAEDGDRPYAALVISVGNALTSQTRLAFRAHATRLMRISVQARHPQSASRWQRSVFLDTTPREIVVLFNDMRPIGNAGAFDPAQVDTVLFVVDRINSVPGSSGTITVADLRVER